jgi:2-methylcitrate dehydratase PrpD
MPIDPTPIRVPPDATRTLAAWVAALRYEDIPSDVTALAKRHILDTLAVAWAATRADSVEAVRQFAVGQGGSAQATMWGFGDRLPVPQAALINGMLAAALDFDSLHDRATVHPDAVVLPAALALGEYKRASGRELIVALVAGNEIMVRLGLAARSHPGWFYSSVFGVFGAAAASARLLRLGAPGVLHAIGIAMSQAAGTQQPLLERCLAKRLQTAFAARNGVEAALLAQCGITGPAQPLEGACGIARLYADLDWKMLTDGLGARYEIRGLALKKYASCMCNHAPIEAALELAAAHDVQPANIESIAVTVSPFMNRLVGAPFSPGDSPQVAAQFSVQYSVASALLRRRFDAVDISTAQVCQPEVLTLAAKVRVMVDDGAGKFVPAVLAVRMKDGTTHESRVDTLPGTPASPLSEAEVRRKALACFEGAASPMSRPRADALIESIDSLDLCTDVGSLFD